MKKKRHWKMPKRIWALPRSTLNYQEKHLLSFIWWCAPAGCHCWNGRLAKKYKVTPRTIRRWLAKLKDLELIAIGHPDGKGRTIWPRYQAGRDGGKTVRFAVSKPKGVDKNVRGR